MGLLGFPGCDSHKFDSTEGVKRVDEGPSEGHKATEEALAVLEV